MPESLQLIFQRLIKSTQINRHRSLFDELNLKNRLTGLIGPRGVGKTTLLLQLIKEKIGETEAFYFSADHIHFSETTLYAFIESRYLEYDTRFIIIDEIHKYQNWQQELKNLYDGFPDLKIIFSGSSSLDLIRGSYDLSRRAKLYHMPGLSFREYLNINHNRNYEVIDYQALLNDPMSFNDTFLEIPQLNSQFKEYLKQGYYPFYYEDPLGYYERILRIIDKTIFEDIANYYQFKTSSLTHFKRILTFLTTMPPGTIRVHNIAKNLSIDDKTVINHLIQMEETGLIKLVYAAEGGNLSLRRPEKVFLNNTNLQYALEGKLAGTIDVGTIRELFFLQSLNAAGIEAFYNKIGDYRTKEAVFEIGDKNKSRKQIKNDKNALLIKDDIILAKKKEIPLYFLGFLY